MLFFFRKAIVDFEWLKTKVDNQFLSDIYKNLKTFEYLTLKEYDLRQMIINTQAFDKGYRTEVYLEITTADLSWIDKVKDEFENVFFFYQNHFRIFKKMLVNDAVYFDDYADNVIITFHSEDFISLNHGHSRFLKNLLVNRKIDTAIYPYDNDKDFFLL
jgi:hypothetical protein